MSDTEQRLNIGLSSKFSHPAASCQTANGLYWEWVKVPDEKIYRNEFQDAKARYQLHLWECDTCREGLDAVA